MNLKQQREAAVKAARAIIDTAKAAARDLTAEETTAIQAHLDEAKSLDVKIKAAETSQALIKQIGDMGIEAQRQGAASGDTDQDTARTLGEHFAKSVGAQLKAVRGQSGVTVAAPEWLGYKAAADPQAIGSVFGNVLTTFDRTIIQAYRPRLVVADLLGSGTLTGNAVTYFVEAGLEGAFTTVAEGAAKPQLHFIDPTVVTDNLKKIAGFIKFTDEMTEDLDFVVSEINGRGLYELGRFEEAQLLSGLGTGTTVTGILARSGIQTETGATKADNPDAVFRAITKIQTGSGLDADGIVINPTDYQALRLLKDANAQYYGGGFFGPAYGEQPGMMLSQPPLWGLRTVVTPAIAAGTVLVGAFKVAATVYRKGGVRVESTNSHASDFVSNLVTVRIEERLALACRVPLGFCKLTLGTT